MTRLPKNFRSLIANLIYVALSLLMTGTLITEVNAQLPDSFENLQVLPEDITEDELMDVMNSFTRALGVNCNRCHLKEESGLTYYASDTLELKRIARYMMKMTKTINETLIAKIDDSGEPKVEVRCYTCHRGKRQPYLIGDVLMASHEEFGVDSLLSKYTELRKKYYGRDVYDLSERALTDAASIMREAKQYDDALKVLAINQNLNPESAWILVISAFTYLDAGDTTNAILKLQGAVDLRPNNNWYKKMLAEMKGEKSPNTD